MRDYLPSREQMGRYMQISQVGLEMVVPIGIGVGIDFWIGWGPWLSIVGTILGLTLGMAHLFYVLNKIEKAEQKEQGKGQDKA